MFFQSFQNLNLIIEVYPEKVTLMLDFTNRSMGVEGRFTCDNLNVTKKGIDKTELIVSGKC